MPKINFNKIIIEDFGHKKMSNIIYILFLIINLINCY